MSLRWRVASTNKRVAGAAGCRTLRALNFLNFHAHRQARGERLDAPFRR
jgi:hypothetical protein